MSSRFVLASALALVAAAASAADPWVKYEGKAGPGKGKSVVLVGGDEEYRSEESLPMLGRLLADRHGFDCTVLFAINPATGEIDPNYGKNVPGLAALDDADLMVIASRFRDLPDDQMRHVDAFLRAGKPVIGLRTATHAFNNSSPEWKHYANGYGGDKKDWQGGFGRLVLGEQWISHHGGHKSESTRGVLADDAKDSPILRGLKTGDVWGDTDVYGVRLPLPGDSKPLVYGQVLSGMKPTDPPVAGPKNDPMMPVAWTKSYQLPGGEKGRSFTTTMGSATDLANAGVRRLVVNAVYDLVGLADAIPPGGTNVDLVGDYHPTMYGFGGFKKGMKPSDYEVNADATAPRDDKSGAKLDLKKGTHLSIIGNTLPERMQHDGYLEAALQSRFPDRELVIRNLSFSADELTIRNRSEGFGSPDEWLTKNETDVVFAFFGFNESFAGAEGLEKFKADLKKFIADAKEKKYNGESAPTLVLFSPIAAEDLKDANLPAASDLNAQIKPYVEAMKAVAGETGTPFVDLFAPSQKAYDAAEPLTIDGVHLNDAGNRAVAEAADAALFGDRKIDWSKLAPLLAAIKDKNFHWFNRYRTTDGYSVYGGRSYLKFVGGQTNREVAQREMEVLDVMTANRDAAVWAAANGKSYKVDDSNTPPFINVETNKPGDGPNGAHIFLSGEDAIKKMTVGKGLAVNLFASEEQFPELASPVQMAWDNKGRLWVAAWPSYPHWKPKDKMDDKLLIFEDTNGDGKADVCKTFAGGLHNPTGFEFWNGGVLVAMAPDLLFLKDTDGDDKADVRESVLSGLDSADTHHTANSFVLGPGGGLYFQEGVFHRTQVETPYGPVRNFDACVWRFDPRTRKLQRYAPYGFANPHGHSFDAWGQDVIHDGTGANPYQGGVISGFAPFPAKHPRAPQVYNQRTRPCPGSEVLDSRHFPDDFQGDLLVGNVIGFQGILRYDMSVDGSAVKGVEAEPVLSSSDPNFRPVDFEIGPDGALYFVDWQNPIIGHMQHNLRDPSRDKVHGRVYRVTAEGRPLLKEPKLAGMPIPDLLDQLKSPELRTRYRARIELSGRKTDEVASGIKTWIASLDKADKDALHHRLEALWVLQGHNAVDLDLLKAVLGSKEPRARAAATRVLSYVVDTVPGSLDLLRSRAADDSPLVRLEAVRAASFVNAPEAVEVAAIARTKPTDETLEFVLDETEKTLEPIWKKAVGEGREIAAATDAGRRFFLGKIGLPELLKKDRTPAVCQELLSRPGVPDDVRTQAAATLAAAEKKPQAIVLLDAIAANADEASVATDLVRLLAARDAAELADARDDVESLATKAPQPLVRQVAFAALAEIDGSADKVWAAASKSPRAERDLLAAVPLISDPGVRAGLYPKIVGVLKDSAGKTAAGAEGRYVRIELPRKGTLTLAEVEVESDGRNVARGGKAKQKNVGAGGEPARAIDGNKNPSYGAGGQTHTEENTDRPWWEVDLGGEHPIESVTVFNRYDGLGQRLDGFTLVVLDAGRNEVFRKEGNPAPKGSARYEVEGTNGASAVRRAAMDALVTLRGHEADAFNLLADLVPNDADRTAAVAALRRIPRQFWPKDRAAPLLAVLTADLKATPVADRTNDASLAAMELADALAGLLPVDQARTVRGELRELGVRVVRLGTLPERMAYDREVLAVQAGKPVAIVFENPDLMPHNFVIVKQGSLEEVGLLAEATGQQPDAAARQYVPKSNAVLLASRLLQSRESEKLSFTAPTEPGVYPYVCTYPGHWRRMYGALYVVADLDAYAADPEGYVAAANLPVRDDLLKDRRPRTEWTFDDLSALVADQTGGRSFATGKQMFQVANCVACHKLNGVGQEIGPDLTKLAAANAAPVELLKSILDPSAKIDEKYQTWVFVTAEGKVVTGMVVGETADEVKVIENPIAKAEPVVLKKSDIDERQKSPTSIMPKGLLDKLDREEILDLIAYLTAKGDEKDPVFKPGVHHDHGHAH